MDFRKKVVPQQRITVREAVTKHGDSWRYYFDKNSRSECRTFDMREYAAMSLYEQGFLPRIPLGDQIEVSA